MTIDLETYEGQIARCDAAKIADAARHVRDFLDAGEDSTAVDYQPDNGTSYRLLFIDPSGLSNHANGEPLVGAWGIAEYQTLVAKCNWTPTDFVYPFDLRRGVYVDVGYVYGALGIGFADACAIVALFRAIVGGREDS